LFNFGFILIVHKRDYILQLEDFDGEVMFATTSGRSDIMLELRLDTVRKGKGLSLGHSVTD
jgi:hypothetical protein